MPQPRTGVLCQQHTLDVPGLNAKFIGLDSEWGRSASGTMHLADSRALPPRAYLGSPVGGGDLPLAQSLISLLRKQWVGGRW